MSEFQIKGRIIAKNDTKSVGANNFQIREFVVEDNGQYPQKIPMQLVKDNVSMLDAYKVGDEVTCHCNVNGREYDKKDNSGKGYFLSLTVWRMEAGGGQQTPPSAPQAPAGLGGGENKEDDLPF